MIAVTRKEKILEAILNSSTIDFIPTTREELFLAKILGMDVETPIPVLRKERLYQDIIDGEVPTTVARKRIEYFIAVAAGAELDLPIAVTREERWWADLIESGAIGGTPTTLRGVSPLTLTNAVKGKLKSLVQFGKCSVSGSDITCNNGVISWGRLNDNLLMPFDEFEENNINTGYNADIKRTTLADGQVYLGVSSNNYWLGETANRYIVSSTADSFTFTTGDVSYGFGYCVSVKPNTKYAVKGEEQHTQVRTSYYAEDGTYLSFGNLWSISTERTFTTPNDCAFVLFVFLPESTDYKNTNLTVSRVMLNEGESVLPYVPYQEGIVTTGTAEEILVESGNILNLDGFTPVTEMMDDDDPRWTVIFTGAGTYYIQSFADGAAGYIYYKIKKTDSTFLERVVVLANLTFTQKEVALAEGESLYLYNAQVRTKEQTQQLFTGWKVTVSRDELTEYSSYSAQTATAVNLYAVDGLCDEQDIVKGKVTRRTEAVVSDGSTPSGRYIGTVGSGNVIVQALETLYKDDVVTFTAEEESPLNLVKAEFSPVQDLHGQDAPYPAGCGKNKFDESAVTNGYYINASGVITPLQGTCYSGLIPVTAGETYTFSCIQASASDNIKRIHAYANDVWQEQIVAQTKSQGTVRLTFTVPVGANGIRISEFNDDYNRQLELGSAATSFAPYENLCPIDGWDEVDFGRAKRNLMAKPSSLLAPQTFANSFFIKAGYYYHSFEIQSATSWRIGIRTYAADGTNISDDSYKPVLNSIASSFYWNSGSQLWLQGGNSTSKKATLYIPKDCYIAFSFSNGDMTSATTVSDIMLTLGNEYVPYEPYHGELIPVQFGPLGKNLFDGRNLKSGLYNKYDSVSHLKPNTTYTWSVYGTSSKKFGLYAGKTNAEVPQPNIKLAGYTACGSHETFTTPADMDEWGYVFVAGNSVGAGSETGLTFQCEEGETSTAYEPYKDTVYGGYLRINRDGSVDLIGEKASKNFVASPGSLNVGTSGAGIKYADLYYSTFGEVLGGNVPILTSAYKQINSAATGADCTIKTYSSAFTIYDNRFIDASTASAILADVQCVYPLATPVTYHLPSIQALKSYIGKNNIWSSTNEDTTVAVSGDEVVEQVTPQPITLAWGDNTVSWTANVTGKEMEAEYKKIDDSVLEHGIVGKALIDFSIIEGE